MSSSKNANIVSVVRLLVPTVYGQMLVYHISYFSSGTSTLSQNESVTIGDVAKDS